MTANDYKPKDSFSTITSALGAGSSPTIQGVVMGSTNGTILYRGDAQNAKQQCTLIYFTDD